MMKIKPEERQKVLLLVAALVLVFCMFGFTVVPRLLPHGPQGQLLIGGHASDTTAASATAPARTLAAGSAPPTGTAPLIGSATPLSPATVITPIPPPPPMATDPFWRPLALSLLPEKLNNITTVRKPNPTIVATNGKSGLSRISGSRTMLASIPPPSLPDVVLQGIVQDDTAIAVLDVGGQTRFLKVGQALEAGWILARIQTTTVTLRQGRREVLLMLGQTRPKDAAPERQESHGLAATLPPFHNVPLEP
ncbi:MAG: hypothetical protein JWL77_1000 [Chthonomonadaceae bacterium]|nr:hypothetical protein [Chthonomonadaceae bacterium]